MVFLDCNFLGFDAGKEASPDPNLDKFYREFLGNEDAKSTYVPSRVLFLANDGLKPSMNLGNHGIFAQTVIEGLKGKADSEGYEPDGNITVGELKKFVLAEQHRLAMANGKSDEEKAQLGHVLESRNLDSDFIISHNPAAYPAAQERLAKFERLAQEQNLDKCIWARKWQHPPERMPKLGAQQNLCKAYQKWTDGKEDLAALQNERKGILEQTMISEKDANTYAIMVLKAAKVVRQGYVKDVAQSTLIDYAINGIFKGLNEKMPSALEEKLAGIKGMKDVDLVKLLTEVRQQLGKREDLANGKDITYSLHSMLGKLDKHTDYIDPDTIRQLDNDIRGQFSGIGVQIRKNNTKDVLQVVTPIRGSPA